MPDFIPPGATEGPRWLIILKFCELDIGDIFLHRGTTYRKKNNDCAAVLGADVNDAIHRFYPEDPVTLADKDSLNGD
jgi:hypothetical protein